MNEVPTRTIEDGHDLNTLYIRVRQGTVARTEPLCSDPIVNVDRDAAGAVLGIEILGLADAAKQRWAGLVEITAAAGVTIGPLTY